MRGVTEETHTKTNISIIIPCYRSADYLAETVREIREAFANAEPSSSGKSLNYAVFMDDDGQHPADRIFPMIDILRKGYHIVYAQFPEAAAIIRICSRSGPCLYSKNLLRNLYP